MTPFLLSLGLYSMFKLNNCFIKIPSPSGNGSQEAMPSILTMILGSNQQVGILLLGKTGVALPASFKLIWAYFILKKMADKNEVL